MLQLCPLWSIRPSAEVSRDAAQSVFQKKTPRAPEVKDLPEITGPGSDKVSTRSQMSELQFRAVTKGLEHAL